MKRQGNQESGQIIVILAIAIVALLGFAALAIDVGMIYSDRRYDQSVADASALAAAQFMVDKLDRISFTFRGVAHTGNGVTNPLCLNSNLDSTGGSYPTSQLISDAKVKAMARAASNNFASYSNNITNGHGIDIQCIPVGDFEQYIEVTSMITSETSTSFAHLFFGGKLINTVTAKTRVYPRTATGFGFSIVAFKDTCFSNFNPVNGNNGEILFSGGGNGTITLKGGGTHSNACMAAGGNAKVNATDGGINVFNKENFVQPSGNGAYVSPPPLLVNSILKPPTIVTPCGTQPPVLTDLPTSGIAQKNKWYSGVKLVGSNKTVQLESGGYYCIAGDIEIGGNSNQFIGDHVTIYMMQGMFKITSTSANVNLVGMDSGAGHGLLIYTSLSNSCNLDITTSDPNTSSKCIDIVGGSSQYYTGTILAPHGFVAFNGNPTISCTSGNSYPTQIMGWMVQIGGTSTMCLSYNDQDQLITPNNMGMSQ